MDSYSHLLLHKQREREAVAAAERRALVRSARRRARRGVEPTPPAPSNPVADRDLVGAH